MLKFHCENFKKPKNTTRRVYNQYFISTDINWYQSVYLLYELFSQLDNFFYFRIQMT